MGHTTSRSFRSANEIKALVPELDSRKSCSMPSLKITPFCPICDSRTSGLSEVIFSKNERRSSCAARKWLAHGEIKKIRFPWKTRLRHDGSKGFAGSSSHSGCAGDQAFEPTGRTESCRNDQAAGGMVFHIPTRADAISRRAVGFESDNRSFTAQRLSPVFSLASAMVTSCVFRPPRKMSRMT